MLVDTPNLEGLALGAYALRCNTMTTQGETLQIVGPKNTFPVVSLIEPTQFGYLMLAIEVDHRPPIGFFVES